jgi:hypothetical protein
MIFIHEKDKGPPLHTWPIRCGWCKRLVIREGFLYRLKDTPMYVCSIVCMRRFVLDEDYSRMIPIQNRDGSIDWYKKDCFIKDHSK